MDKDSNIYYRSPNIGPKDIVECKICGRKVKYSDAVDCPSFSPDGKTWANFFECKECHKKQKYKDMTEKRQIKFRGKREDNRKWVYGDLVTFGENNMCILHGGVSAIDSLAKVVFNNVVIPETVGQFTGFKDKNDCEIYDGDILTDQWDFSAPVKWNSHCGCWWIGTDWEYFNIESEDGVIIDRWKTGNIHDNK